MEPGPGIFTRIGEKGNIIGLTLARVSIHTKLVPERITRLPFHFTFPEANSKEEF